MKKEENVMGMGADMFEPLRVPGIDLEDSTVNSSYEACLAYIKDYITTAVVAGVDTDEIHKICDVLENPFCQIAISSAFNLHPMLAGKSEDSAFTVNYSTVREVINLYVKHLRGIVR